MSNIILFDSQNQRWMVSQENTNIHERLTAYKTSNTGIKTASIALVSIVALTLFGRYLEGKLQPRDCLFVLAPLAVAVHMIHMCSKNRMIKKIEEHVQEWGWGDFKQINPEQGQYVFAAINTPLVKNPV